MIKVYVDGCYNRNKNIIGWGIVVVDEGKKLFETNGSITDPSLTSMYQVPGEVMATVEAVSYCIDNNIKDMCIYYDYKGIEDWVTGAWRAKNSFTKSYVEYMSLASRVINFSFVKVKSHSGDYFNDCADRLSKVACGVLSA